MGKLIIKTTNSDAPKLTIKAPKYMKRNNILKKIIFCSGVINIILLGYIIFNNYIKDFL